MAWTYAILELLLCSHPLGGAASSPEPATSKVVLRKLLGVKAFHPDHVAHKSRIVADTSSATLLNWRKAVSSISRLGWSCPVQ
jgi:hypothetical protein